MSWILLILAGLEEVVGVTAIKYIDGLKRKVPIIVIIAGFIFSFICLSQAMQSIPSGVAYVVWTGIGTLGVTLVDIIWFRQRFSMVQWLFLGCIIVGIVGMRFTAGA
ncbi:quaternary ammonium compound-resistance protein SugE [Scopulibacillus darangshiensis]|uniref:Quaternary ammonium compound-resistance protein SugE n=1 Tax=Scopulibacillus darangshiensis TaxID=442528 RepID=A0A4R2P981_9BACL|nr:multidrug efflux SMR transporter [Scopulibacillus darangshiensis]TCP30621.1 quaternary ammonium compound-resistance protein SugE [Scopulibacillus darangshiensis]